MRTFYVQSNGVFLTCADNSKRCWRLVLRSQLLPEDRLPVPLWLDLSQWDLRGLITSIAITVASLRTAIHYNTVVFTFVPSNNCAPLIWMSFITYYFIGGNSKNIYLFYFGRKWSVKVCCLFIFINFGTTFSLTMESQQWFFLTWQRSIWYR